LKQGAPEKRGINQRDDAILKRLEVGHWEGDTVISTKKGGKGGVVRIRERLTRKSISRIVPDLKAETVLGALRGMFHDLPAHMRKSLTLDNGSEFAYSMIIKLEGFYPGFLVYYCDAYASWQKGSIENSNKALRWYYPKGTDFGKVLPFDLYRCEDKINDRPMKCHQGFTANEMFESHLKIAA
jgi:IS30 family transposase